VRPLSCPSRKTGRKTAIWPGDCWRFGERPGGLLKVDRYRRRGALESSHEYLLVSYGAQLPSERIDLSEFETVGAADTRSLPESLCDEIEAAIASREFWIGDLPARLEEEVN
jgi:hypothetical protein